MTTMMPSGDVTKLPKWAQDHIRSLELQNQSLASDMAQMTGTVDSPTSYSVGTETPMPLPKNATVRFQLGENSDEVINAKVQQDQGRTILVIGALTRKIIIEPTASNRIVLTTSWE